MAQPSNLSSLPTELLDQIVGYLDHTGDVNSVCRLNRRFHYLFLPTVIGIYVGMGSQHTKLGPENTPRHRLFNLFLHAVKHNSLNLIQELTSYADQLDLKGFMQRNPIRAISFLHFALVMDAPRVAGHLMKHGADITQNVGDYPDLTSLYLALARYRISNQKELDAALRIACSYALPRTTRFLLTRGADVNAMSTYGVAAVHTAVIKRVRWRYFDELHKMLYPGTDYGQATKLWESAIFQTVATLLEYGVDIRRKTSMKRAHACDYNCWRSVDCNQRGQTALHLASASGLTNVVKILLDSGAPLESPNDDGYTPLYGALVQGHEETAHLLLQHSDKGPNPTVSNTYKSTALHVACRFAFSEMVHRLLGEGADANALDSDRRTPLHEVLEQTRFDRQDEVILTLQYLDKFGADPDIRATNTQTPRQIVEKHPFSQVRELFRWIESGCQDSAAAWPELREEPWEPLSTWGYGSDNSLSRARQKGFPIYDSRMQHATEPEINNENFPALDDRPTGGALPECKTSASGIRDNTAKSHCTPERKKHPTKDFDAAFRIAKKEPTAPVVEEPIPQLGTTRTKRRRAKRYYTGATSTGLSKNKTTQVKATKAPPSPPKSAPPRKSNKAFPAPGKCIRGSASTVAPNTSHAETAMAKAPEKMRNIDDHKAAETKSEIESSKSSKRRRKKKRKPSEQ